jgi:hypothetical protein
MVTDESGCLRQTFVIKPVHDLCHRVALYHVPLIAETMIEQIKRRVECVGRCPSASNSDARRQMTLAIARELACCSVWTVSSSSSRAVIVVLLLSSYHS